MNKRINRQTSPSNMKIKLFGSSDRQCQHVVRHGAILKGVNRFDGAQTAPCNSSLSRGIIPSTRRVVFGVIRAYLHSYILTLASGSRIHLIRIHDSDSEQTHANARRHIVDEYLMLFECGARGAEERTIRHFPPHYASADASHERMGCTRLLGCGTVTQRWQR